MLNKTPNIHIYSKHESKVDLAACSSNCSLLAWFTLLKPADRMLNENHEIQMIQPTSSHVYWK